MANIRPSNLSPAVVPLRTGDVFVIDQGTEGVNKVNVYDSVNTVAPVATTSEAQIGSDDTKRMTPLKTKQSIASEVGVTIASFAQGQKADNAVQSVNGKTGNSVTLVKGDVGLGNVDNTSDLDKPISAATQTALNGKATSAQGAKADSAIQALGGTTGQVLTKNSNTDNDVAWQTVAAATAVSYAPQTLNSGQQSQARANISAYLQPTGTTAEYLRGDGSAATLNKAAVGLGNVDNTSDLSKPISTATQAALNGKVAADTITTAGFVSGNSNEPYFRKTDNSIIPLVAAHRILNQLAGWTLIGGVGAVGTYAFCQNNTGTTLAPGQGTGGSGISYASATTSPGQAPPGNWICMGYCPNGDKSMFFRYE